MTTVLIYSTFAFGGYIAVSMIGGITNEDIVKSGEACMPGMDSLALQSGAGDSESQVLWGDSLQAWNEGLTGADRDAPQLLQDQESGGSTRCS